MFYDNGSAFSHEEVFYPLSLEYQSKPATGRAPLLTFDDSAQERFCEVGKSRDPHNRPTWERVYAADLRLGLLQHLRKFFPRPNQMAILISISTFLAWIIRSGEHMSTCEGRSLHGRSRVTEIRVGSSIQQYFTALESISLHRHLHDRVLATCHHSQLFS